MLMLLFLVVVVADARFLIDAAQPVGRAGFVQDCLGQRRLAAAAVPQEDDVANIAGISHFSGLHHSARLLVSVRISPKQMMIHTSRLSHKVFFADLTYRTCICYLGLVLSQT